MKKLLFGVVLAAALAGGFLLLRDPAEAGFFKKSAEALPVEINKAAKEVIMPAEVNGKYFTEPTRHGVVFLGGSNGEKAVLRGLSDEKQFYDALLAIGAKPGNNLKLDDMKAGPNNGKSVKGSKLNVFVKWEGSKGEIPFQNIIRATVERPMDIRFGGNLEAAKKANTGCVLCLDSCAVGITSNAAYPTGTTQNKVSEFYGRKDILPPDGTRVFLIFRLAK